MSPAERLSELLEYASARAAEWGMVLRQSGWHGAPNSNYYNATPYLMRRGDTGMEALEHTEREVRAAIVHRYYLALRENGTKEAEALWLQYAASRPGKHSELKTRDKMRLWRASSGESKTRFYERLSVALDGLSLYLVEIAE